MLVGGGIPYFSDPCLILSQSKLEISFVQFCCSNKNQTAVVKKPLFLDIFSHHVFPGKKKSNTGPPVVQVATEPRGRVSWGPFRERERHVLMV